MQRLTRSKINKSLTWVTEGTPIYMYKCTGYPLKGLFSISPKCPHFAAQVSIFIRSFVFSIRSNVLRHKGHVVYVYWIDTVYVQNNLPTEFSKRTIFII